MSNYFRITGYCESEDFCFILDCYGMFEKLWQFSSFLVQKGLKILEVSSTDKFLDGNIPRAPENVDKLLLRASAKGKPEYVTQAIDGVTYTAVKVADKFYVPDRTQAI
ncbi:hypothetical protein [Pumilibacter intestinalis]|uniref:hypothetical protein n=1 Tax=Pumilibacter intestinalis TaxID=2941511 RepID=UPI00203CD83D|nr:hypothetical protein [Pumilibacter intestinalis]